MVQIRATCIPWETTESKATVRSISVLNIHLLEGLALCSFMSWWWYEIPSTWPFFLIWGTNHVDFEASGFFSLSVLIKGFRFPTENASIWVYQNFRLREIQSNCVFLCGVMFAKKKKKKAFILVEAVQYPLFVKLSHSFSEKKIFFFLNSLLGGF